MIRDSETDPFEEAKRYFAENADQVVYNLEGSRYEFIQNQGRVYQLYRHPVLGEGGFGRVHKGMDENGNFVAIKVENVSGQKAHAKQLKENENAILAYLGKLKGYATQKLSEPVNFMGKPAAELSYTIMTLEPGRNLGYEVFSRKGQLSRADRLAIGLKVTYEVSWLQAMGLVHADLKGGNLMMSLENSEAGKQFMINSVDFGHSLYLGGQEYYASNVVLGSEGYRAPEVVKGTQPGEYAEYSFYSDVFALGKILANDLEFEGDQNSLEFQQILQAMCHDSWDQRPDVTTILGGIVKELKAELLQQSDPDETFIALVNMAEAHLNYASENTEPVEPSYREIATQSLLEECQSFIQEHQNKANKRDVEKIQHIIQGDYPTDEKLIAIKGFLQKNKIKSSQPLLSKINKHCGKARFLGENGCQEHFARSKTKPTVDFQFAVEQGLQGASPEQARALKAMQAVVEESFDIQSVSAKHGIDLRDLLQKTLATNNPKELKEFEQQVLRVKQKEIAPSKQIRRGLQFAFRRHQKKVEPSVMAPKPPANKPRQQ